MTAKIIVVPALPVGLTITVQVKNITTLTVLETVTCTGSGGDYTGTISGAHAGQLLFVILASGLVLEHRVRTIRDVAETFIILTELEELAVVDSGPSALTVTVDDGTDPLSGAIVRVSGTGLSRTKTTDGSGEALFAVADGDYEVIVVKPGFDSEFRTVTVSGSTPLDVTLTEISVTAPDEPYKATGNGITLDEEQEPEDGVFVSIQMVEGPDIAGFILDGKIRTEVSADGGVVEFAGMLRGATYEIWRGPGTVEESEGPFSIEASFTKRRFVVPNEDTFSLSEVIGIDAEEEV
jgi:hypothetical protein